tara:strand:+ start:1325 stop:1720 length:396 start_codon:yes stop_codon:yes gene_type:complete
MASYGAKSMSRLMTCHPDIQMVMVEVVKEFDNAILEGERGEERQNFLFDSGQSEVQFPNGKHNTSPSRAVDAAPWPLDWENKERFILFGGYVLGVAARMGVNLVWGGDWNKDWNTKDHKFFDGPHFQLADE